MDPVRGSLWQSALDTLSAAEKSHLDAQTFAEAVRALKGSIAAEQPGSVVHRVPMRMLSGLAEILEPYKRTLEKEVGRSRHVWFDSLYEFLRKRPEGHACLIVLDSLVARGKSRQAFCRLLTTHPEVLARYQRIVLAALIALPDSPEEAPKSLFVRNASSKGVPREIPVDVRVGRFFQRPSDLQDEEIESALRLSEHLGMPPSDRKRPQSFRSTMVLRSSRFPPSGRKWTAGHRSFDPWSAARWPRAPPAPAPWLR